MRYLSIFLLIPFLSAHAAPTCDELKNIAKTLEEEIQNKSLPDCDKLTPKDIGQPDDAIGFPNVKKRDGADGNWDYRCKDFSAIDQQLKSIENELALLTGINKLKTEIDQALATFKNNPEHEVIRGSSKSFYTNVKVAATLEDFLHTNNDNGDNILSKVIFDKGGWTDINSFAALLRKHCAGFPSVDSVCQKGYGITPEVFTEIDSFVKAGKASASKFEKNHIKDLTKALSIKKGKEKYSYNHLLLEIKDPGEGVLSDADLEKIKELPQLESGDDDFIFQKQLKLASKNLKNSKEVVYAQGTPDRFRTLLTDLKNREEWELKSKLSLVLHKYAPPADLKAKCDEVRELGGDVSTCLGPLAKTLKGTEASIVEDFNLEMKYGQAHVARLADLQARCIPNEKMELHSDCETLFKGITDKMANLTEKANVLQALKVKHMQLSPDRISLRNFALQKLLSGECVTEGDADIGECYPDLGTIPREAATLTGNAGEILFVLENPKAEIDIDRICDESEEKVTYKKDLCDLAEEEAKKSAKGKVNVDSYNAPTDPAHRDTSKEGFLAAGQTLLGAIAGMFAPKPQPMINPYMNNMNPYPMMAQPQDISQKIMGPYMARGFGNYYPTPGLRPYSSVNSNVGTFSAYDVGGGKFFNSPVGW